MIPHDESLNIILPILELLRIDVHIQAQSVNFFQHKIHRSQPTKLPSNSIQPTKEEEKTPVYKTPPTTTNYQPPIQASQPRQTCPIHILHLILIPKSRLLIRKAPIWRCITEPLPSPGTLEPAVTIQPIPRPARRVHREIPEFHGVEGVFEIVHDHPQRPALFPVYRHLLAVSCLYLLWFSFTGSGELCRLKAGESFFLLLFFFELCLRHWVV